MLLACHFYTVLGRKKNMSEAIRINKYLSMSGFCSRRKADEYIIEGKVTIDGEVAQAGSKVLSGQKVCVNGKELSLKMDKIMIAFHKPKGIVCTASKKDKDNIIDYINYSERIFPVGRLDKDSTGLILLTNDGEWMDRILRGRNGHEKEYIVRVNKRIKKDVLKAMEQGVPILDTITRPCKVTAISDTEFRIILTQGLNRQIRRMCEYFGYRVLELKRVRIMNIELGDLQEGKWRHLRKEEMLQMEKSMKGKKFYNE